MIEKNLNYQQLNKSLPYSKEAEQAIIATIIAKNEILDNLLLDFNLQEEDFYLQEHRKIFQKMINIQTDNQPIDVITIADRLDKDHNNSIDLEFLGQLVLNTPIINDYETYIKIIKDKYIKRNLINILVEIGKSINKQDANNILNDLEQKVFEINKHSTNEDKIAKLNDIMPDAIRQLNEFKKAGDGITGIATGFEEFDKITAGLQAGDLIVIGSRPSMGKTTFATNLIENIITNSATDKKNGVLFFSLEMPAVAIVNRIFASLSQINMQKIRTGHLSDEEWRRLLSTQQSLENAELYIDESQTATPFQVMTKARKLYRKLKGNLALIVIDYLQLMHDSSVKHDNRVLEISKISRLLKALAKELMVPIIVLSQLNRGVESRNDKRPMLSDVRESGAIEQDADLVVFIYRDEYYNKEASEYKGLAEIIIAKHRNGPTGHFKLQFESQIVQFSNLTEDEYEENFNDDN